MFVDGPPERDMLDLRDAAIDMLGPPSRYNNDFAEIVKAAYESGWDDAMTRVRYGTDHKRPGSPRA